MGAEKRPQQGEWVDAEGAEGLAQVLIPDSSGTPHSYEGYAQSDASVYINNYAMGKISGKKSRLLDVGSGTGASIQASLEGGKLARDFRAIGIDIDRKGLLATREKFRHYNGVDYSGRIELVHGSGEQLPAADGWADLVTSLNTVHLFDNTQKFFDEAYRVLRDGDLVVNSAYVKDSMYANKDSKRALQSMFVGAARYVQKRGFKPGQVFDPARFTKEEYEGMARKAGFIDVKVEIHTVHMGPKDIAAIFRSEEFEDGALPDVPYHIAARGLVGSIKSRLKRFQISTIDRNWMVMTAKKAA